MIWAGIVIFNPKIERLIANIQSILEQVDGLILFINECNEKCKNYIENLNNEKINIIWNEKNAGIAVALNSIMKQAQNNGVDWVVTLDQDSICPDTMIKQFSTRMENEHIGIICPRVVDKRRIYLVNQQVKMEDMFVERCITSASCTRVKAWASVGGFDDILFIDLVDNDFCKRLRLKGWKICKINSLVLDQEYGDITPKGSRTIKIIGEICKRVNNHHIAKNIGKLSYKKNVNPLRVYYTNRNVIYLNKKFKNHGGIGYDTYCCNTYIGFMITFNLASFLRGKEKIKILKAIIYGIMDGHKIPVTLVE